MGLIARTEAMKPTEIKTIRAESQRYQCRTICTASSGVFTIRPLATAHCSLIIGQKMGWVRIQMIANARMGSHSQTRYSRPALRPLIRALREPIRISALSGWEKFPGSTG